MKRTLHLEKLSKQYSNIPTSFIREILKVAEQGQMISFAGGLPSTQFFPVKELAESAYRVLIENGKSVLQYADSLGYYPLRKWIADRYSCKFKMKITPEMILITNGSQQAVDICAKIFINEGDSILIEKPSYLGAIQAMSAYLPIFREVELNNDGVNCEMLNDLARQYHPKLFYSIPNFQNPTGISYSLEIREQVAKIVEHNNLLCIEDDPYSEIRFSGEFLPPIKKFALDNVLWTGSFSKMIAPGVRLGWIVVPEHLISHFNKAKQACDLHSNNLSQHIVYDYVTHNKLDDHLDRIRKGYFDRCSFMLEMVEKYLPSTVKTTHPAGGMFLWLTLPLGYSSEDLVTRVLKRGVVFVPGRSFFTTKNDERNIRMNFSNANIEDIEKGVKIMSEELELIKNEKRIIAYS